VRVGGWHGDAAWTFLVGEAGPDARRLVKAAWAASLAGIRAARAGGRLGDVGEAVQDVARKYGCSVIEDYVGHGIGRALHEDPMVPNFGQHDTGTRIVSGMVFTIEPMLNLGGREAHVSSDRSLSAQFEHTVAIFRDSTEVLTFPQGDIFASLAFPPAF
jgi:methionyl aminopeptidase